MHPYQTDPSRQKPTSRKAWLLVILVFGALAALVGACVVDTVVDPPIWTERIPVQNATYHTIVMTDHRDARNVTYDQLIDFLDNDTTEAADYAYPDYTCGDFALKLHDNAEAAGIKCGIVAVTINTTEYIGINTSLLDLERLNNSDKGHAFNVFNTTDRGLVYIDATGIQKAKKKNGRMPYKMVAYVENGLPLGEIIMNQSEGFDYSYYDQKEKKFLPFAQNVSRYLDELSAYMDEKNVYDKTVEDYDRDVDGFNAEYHNFSVALNSSPDSAGLEKWRLELVADYSALEARSRALRQEDGALQVKKRILDEKRDTLEQAPEAKWIMVLPAGVVDTVSVYW
jgi:hypothetical protein